MGLNSSLQWENPSDVSTTELADLSVSTAKLAADAVTAAKLADDAVVPVNAADAAVLAGTSAVGLAGVPYVVYVPMAAGGSTGTADDVFAGQVAGKCRIVDVVLAISTGILASTITLRSASGGGGTALSDDIATTAASDQGMNPWNHTSFPEIAAGSSLYLRRSDRAVVGAAKITLLPVA